LLLLLLLPLLMVMVMVMLGLHHLGVRTVEARLTRRDELFAERRQGDQIREKDSLPVSRAPVRGEVSQSARARQTAMRWWKEGCALLYCRLVECSPLVLVVMLGRAGGGGAAAATGLTWAAAAAGQTGQCM
jgi:hypothetical protein